MRIRTPAVRRPITRDDSGAVAVLMGALLTVLVGFVGLGVEVGLWWFEKSKAQGAADAAAFAAGVEMMRLEVGESLDEDEMAAIKQAGLAAAADHGFNNNVTITADAGADTVEAVVENPLEPLLVGMLLAGDTVDIAAQAKVVAAKSSKNVCILSLNESATPGINARGNAKAILQGCGIHSNSTSTGSNGSLCVQGSSYILTDNTVSASGIFCPSHENSKDHVQDLHGNPIEIQENAPTLENPYGELKASPPAGCTESAINYQVKHPEDLQDKGYYCGGLKFKDTVELNPGTYYVGGDISFSANANVTGSGVTFVLMKGATLSINGRAALDLTAPKNGDFAGVIFFQDPASLGEEPKKTILNGNANVRLNGAIYFPATEVQINGTFSSEKACMQLIAGMVDLGGTQDLHIQHAGECDNGTKKPYTQRLALIE